MVKIINKTPHQITMVFDSGETFIFPKSENPIRLEEKQEEIGKIHSIPIMKKTFKKSSLPEKENETFFIVSLIVAQSFPERQDFLIVNDTIRDNQGKIIGCKSFARV